MNRKRRGESLTAAAIYRDLVKVSGYSRSQAVKSDRRNNGTISRAHRLQAVLFYKEPSVMELRKVMVEMASLYRNSKDGHLRQQARGLYFELLNVWARLELAEEHAPLK